MLLVVLLAAASLAGCGTSSTGGSTPSDDPSGPPIQRTGSSGFVRLGSFDCGCLDRRSYYYGPGQFVPGHVFATSDPDGSGQQVAAFAIANSDQPYTGAPPRGDLFFQFPLRPGSDVYISIPVRIPAGLPLEQGGASKFFQWAQLDYPGAPEPSLGLNVGAEGDDQNHYDLGIHASPETVWVGPRVDGRWHTAILHVHVQPDNSGFVELWWDGVPQTFTDGTTTWYAATINRNQNGDYLEELDIDEYRARNSMPGTVTIYHGAPAIGPTLASVARTVTGGHGP